jgi:hypothetical protein
MTCVTPFKFPAMRSSAFQLAELGTDPTQDTEGIAQAFGGRKEAPSGTRCDYYRE